MTRRAISAGAAAALAGALATGALASGIVAQTYVHPEGTSGTALGAAVASIGPRIVLGAPDASSPGCPFYGAVHVFDGETGAPLLKIVDESPEPCFGRLGWSVAEIDGDILASAPFRTESGAATSSGAVYRFDATTGALKRTFLHPAPSDRDPDVFGAALAVAGGDVWIGSPEGAEVTVGGEVLPSGIVFHFDATTGDLLGSLTSPTPAPNDSFGSALATSSGRIFVGAPGAIDSPGAVHAFDLATGQHLWTATDAEVGSFGRAVAANDTIVAVGDPFRSFGDGSVHLLGASDGALVRRLDSPDPNPSFAGNNFGFSVARFGGGFLVGAPQTETGGFLPGIAYLFDASTGALAYRFNLLDFRSELGTAVASLGDRVLVGAPGYNVFADLSGGAVLFETCASLGDGAACDDGNGCDTGDVCQGTVCVPGTPVTCPTPPQCRLLGCEPRTGLCNERSAPNESLCFLGGPTTCSVGDRCDSGRCFRNFNLPPPEQRDSDFDGVCVSDDDCPTVANPGQEDADSDLAGDACDPNDGLLLLHSAVLRANREGHPATGRLTLRGELLSRSDEIGLRPFNPDGGISVRIEDAASFAQGFTWTAGQCTGSDRLRCIRSGRPTARIDFHPLQQRTDGIIVYTFSMKLDGVDVETPLVEPLQTRLTSQPATPVIGFDRVGAVGGCSEGRRRFSCRVAVPGSASEAFLDLPASLVD